MDLMQGLVLLTPIHLLATASPGPEFMLISREALSHGRRAGLLCLFGTMLGLLIHLGYSAFGFAVLIASSPAALWGIRVLGGSYLIYLGFSALRARPARANQALAEESVSAGSASGIRKGFLCDLLNPKAPIYYVSLFTFVLSPEMPGYQVAVYGAWILLIHFSWFCMVVLLLSNPAVNLKFRSVSHWIDRVLGGAMVAIGLKILTTAS